MAVIEVENLSKHYRLGSIGATSFLQDFARFGRSIGLPLKEVKTNNTFTALDDVSFRVEEGEVIGIIGANGAGKSTLLKILSRITEPSSGIAKLSGRVGSLLEVGTGFHGDMTGRENVFLNGTLYGLTRSEIKAQFDSIVEFAEVEKFIDTPVKRYSSGMFVRLAFSVAAHLQPEILIVDEVLAVGDANFQKRCIGKMKDVSQSGRTVLFVSHQMQAVSNLCDRAILLKNGKIHYSGTTDSAISRYLEENITSSYQKAGLRKDRSGSGEAKLEEIKLIDNQTNKKEGSWVITTQISCKEKDYPLNGYLSLVIHHDGTRLFTVSTMWKEQKIPLQDGMTLKWEIDASRLTMGQYTLDFMIQLNPGDQPVDYLLNCLSIDMPDCDYWGTGRRQHPGLDKVFNDFTFDQI
ncbi:polysaccharide ABC transporter ATP-binding protein [Opitutales bacterium]|nr:polysaccharide ABC transporter ATP-binding protein [Opitutales bacterium]